MGVSRVDFGGETLVDLTGDTVTPQSLLSGYSAHNKAGELIEGLVVIPKKVSELENDAGYAKTKSPTFTGTPKAPTPPDNTNNTQIATTAFVKKLISNLVNGAPETLDTLKEIADALGENDDAVQALNAAIGNKVDKVSGKGLSTNDFTTAEKNKLAGISDNANKYSLPLATSSVRGGAKVGYAENGKNYPVELSNEQMFVNVPWTDNNTWKANTANSEGYVTSGSGHANQVWKTNANGVPGWRTDANTTYGAATTSANGLMTAAMVTKLNGIATGANKTTYTNNLTATVAGTALDAVQGKAINDKGKQVSVYVGSDGKLHFRNWAGADSVLNFNIIKTKWQSDKFEKTGSIVKIYPDEGYKFSSIYLCRGKYVSGSIIVDAQNFFWSKELSIVNNYATALSPTLYFLEDGYCEYVQIKWSGSGTNGYFLFATEIHK